MLSPDEIGKPVPAKSGPVGAGHYGIRSGQGPCIAIVAMIMNQLFTVFIPGIPGTGRFRWNRDSYENGFRQMKKILAGMFSVHVINRYLEICKNPVMHFFQSGKICFNGSGTVSLKCKILYVFIITAGKGTEKLIMQVFQNISGRT